MNNFWKKSKECIKDKGFWRFVAKGVLELTLVIGAVSVLGILGFLLSIFILMGAVSIMTFLSGGGILFAPFGVGLLLVILFLIFADRVKEYKKKQ